MQTENLEGFQSRLLSLFAAQFAFNRQTTVLVLQEEPILFRYCGPSGKEAESLSFERLTTYENEHWCPVARLSGILHECANELLAIASPNGWACSTLTSLTCRAYRWSHLLASQMGTGALAAGKTPSTALLQAGNASLEDAEYARQVVNVVSRNIGATIQEPPARRWRMTNAAMIQFVRESRAIHVRWLATSGKELCRETLEEWVQRMSLPRIIGDQLAQLETIRSRRESSQNNAEHLLRSHCPELADAVEHACRTNRIVGYPVCPRATVHALPAQLRLYLAPGMPPGRASLVHLVALRAHEEFVLQNNCGQLYYFPPCQLMAIITFDLSSRVWYTSRPRVRMPKGGPGWVHPYTGPLAVDPFSSAEMVGGDPWEPVVATTREGKALLAMRPILYPESVSNDLCLAQQEQTIAKLDRSVRLSESAGRVPNLWGLVWGLWNLVAVGLTHGAMRNEDRPRASMGAEMNYHVRQPGKLAGTRLAARVFPYDPARPVVL